MDVDRYIAEHRPAWSRLEELTQRAGRGPQRLQPRELPEFVRLYLRVSSQLSTVRTVYGDPTLTAELTSLVAAAGAVVYGTRARTLRTIGVFFTTTFPAAVWHARRPVLASATMLLVAGLIMGIWLGVSPTAVEVSAPPEVREAYIEHEFEDYYSSRPAGQFASEVFTNNVSVAIRAFAGGILLCVGTAYVLLLNGAYFGQVAGLFHAAGAAGKFWGLVLPHGLLELTAICIAGGAGLRLGWAIIDPGDRPRRESLADEGRRAVVIVLGLVVAFLVAGVIEAFVTPSPLPTWARIAVGAVVEAAFLAYLFVQGRAAAAAGLTGAVGERARRVVTPLTR